MAINAKLADFSANSYVTVEEANTYFGTRSSTTAWDALATTAKEAYLKQSTRDVDNFNFVEAKYYEAQPLEFPRDDHETVSGNCATAQGESTATLLDDVTFKNTVLNSDTYMAMPNNYWQYGSCHLTDDNLVELIASSNTDGIVHMDTAFTASLTTDTAFRVFAPIYPQVKEAVYEQALFILDNPGLDSIQAYKSLGSNKIRIGDVSVEIAAGSMSKITISPTAKKLLSRYIKRTMTSARR